FFKLMLEISINGCYILFMNRRSFIQSLAAALALPAAPALTLKATALPAAAPHAAAATALATKARFWTIYMYGLHGNCTPATLSTMLNIPETQARGFLKNLIADGTIRPHALLRNSLTKTMKSESEGVVEKLGEPVKGIEEDEISELLEHFEDVEANDVELVEEVQAGADLEISEVTLEVAEEDETEDLEVVSELSDMVEERPAGGDPRTVRRTEPGMHNRAAAEPL
ncbi:MAG: hypothetical protein WBC71_01210, partial [Salaquimonas sp.]